MPQINRPEYISDAYLTEVIRTGLAEDVGDGDVTSLATVSPDTRAEGTFVCKQGGVVAGLSVASQVFRMIDDSVRLSWKIPDGANVRTGDVAGTVRGPAISILTAERLALNILQRMGGIATMTRKMVDAVSSYHTKILDTRKTAPGLRLLDKWAVLLGGGTNHRIGLYDMILIKENHISSAGGIENAISAARKYANNSSTPLKIEVEVTTLDEVRRALQMGGIDYLLLDNMTSVHPDGRLDTSLLTAAIELIDGAVETEASGNVTLGTVARIADTGVNNISCGALTHSVQALDISLLLNLHD
jgi:nicotinate-nucleotide pyrophosphorylase (carboxylating)